MGMSKEYIKGFNSGYLLRKHKPILMKELENGIRAISPYSKGLLDGNKEYEIELDLKLRTKLDQKLNGNRRDKGFTLGF